MKPEILISLCSLNNPNWRNTIADLKRLDIRRFALFTTTITDQNECLELLKTIKKEIPGADIPFAHIRKDMPIEQIDFMIDNFKTKAINIHPICDYPLVHNYDKYRAFIFVENAEHCIKDGLSESDLAGFAGVCLDLAHLENTHTIDKAAYDKTLRVVDKHTIGANHLSAIKHKLTDRGDGVFTYDSHYLDKLSELDYLKHYYPKYFGRYSAIELTNSILDQIEIKKYIEKLLDIV